MRKAFKASVLIVLSLLLANGLMRPALAQEKGDEMKHVDDKIVSDEMALNYHLMHPGGDSGPGDPNVAFCLDGTYHLHYILQHPFRGRKSFSFIHVTSPDMLHWTWQRTKLQPAFTGHGMFSGTGFITKEGKPAAIYAGLSDPGHTHIAIAKDNSLSQWEKPYPVQPKGGPDGKDTPLIHDPDCFLLGDTYYAFSAWGDVFLCKSTDLKNWAYVGPFMKHELPDVTIGEDISCANFFPFGGKWLLLCISHSMGCRYYLGDWDAAAEQFVPESHGRMSWRRAGQSLTNPCYRDFFAPESVLTPDGRRVMWAWLTSLHPEINQRTVQSLPRELSLGEEGNLRMLPLRELESLRYDLVTINDVVAVGADKKATPIAELDGDSFEIRVTIDRQEADRRRIGLLLFAGEESEGLPVVIRPESGTINVGETEAPFAVADLPEDEHVDLRVFVDKYLVEVFVNGRQATVSAYMGWRDGGKTLKAYCFCGWGRPPAKFRKVEIWKLKPTNQGFFEARENRIWAPEID